MTRWKRRSSPSPPALARSRVEERARIARRRPLVGRWPDLGLSEEDGIESLDGVLAARQIASHADVVRRHDPADR